MDGGKIAVVGPGRSRNGLGPFLAGFCEEAGLRVVAAAGRDGLRTEAACAEFAVRFGHPVAAFTEVDRMLAVSGADALVIASPAAAHLEALRAALEHGAAVLCEKPLVAPAQGAAVEALLDAFAERGLLLVENCQWPETLHVFEEVWPGLLAEPITEVAMRLSPTAGGRAMLEDSLSHLLSVAQVAAAIGPGARLLGVELEGAGPASEAAEMRATVAQDGRQIRLRLELRRVPEQPRPAWVELDGHRLVRTVDQSDGGYRLAFEAPGGKRVPFDDPTRSLVYRFADCLREPSIERVRAESQRVRERARLYAGIVAGWRG